MDDWGVWCEVSGGFMGYRTAWLKEDGRVWTGPRDEAEAKATTENVRSKSPYSTASFRYTAMVWN